MTFAGSLRLAVAVMVLILLHFSLRPLLGWTAEIDFLTTAVLIAAVRLRPGTAALLGCILGLANDSLRPAMFGAWALALTAVGFAASWLKAIFFADNLALNGLMILLGKWLVDAIRLLVERSHEGTALVMQLFVWSLLSAAVTAVVGVIVLLLLRPLLEPQRA